MPSDSKTEKATPKKKRDERKEGHVPLSKDIVTVSSLLVVFASLQILFPIMHQALKEFLIECVSDVGRVDDLSIVGKELLWSSTILIAETCLPILLIAIAVSVIATGAQTKFLFTGKSVRPKFSKLNPINGIKNIVSLKSLVELLKNIIKIIILIYLLYTIIKGDLRAISRTINMDLISAMTYTLQAVVSMVYKAVLVFAAIACFDFFYQRWDFDRDIRMSKEELKEEYKQTEGNPEIKGRIRNLQRQRAQSRMMQNVPDADVIIRNPTHVAVALRYKLNSDNAPVLLAKGLDEVALRIVKVGEEHDIHVVENRTLARAIYAETKIGQEIPEEYYGMVAELLVYVYRLNHVDLI